MKDRTTYKGSVFFWLISCIILFSSSPLYALKQSFVSEVASYSDVLPPERITVEGRFMPAIQSDYLQVLRLNYSNQFGVLAKKLYLAIAAGDYQLVIDEAQKRILELGAIWEIEERDLVNEYAETMNLLGTAYELKGDWQKAINVYATAYGEKSNNFRWAKIRVLFAVGKRKEAFKLICDAVGEVEWASPKSVAKKVQEHRSWLESLQRPNEKSDVFSCLLGFYNELDPEWFAIWQLRYNCLRIICPEAPYVSTTNRSDVKKGIKCFYELQKESFESIVDFMTTMYDELDDSDMYKDERIKARIEFLSELKQIPYQ